MKLGKRKKVERNNKVRGEKEDSQHFFSVLDLPVILPERLIVTIDSLMNESTFLLFFFFLFSVFLLFCSNFMEKKSKNKRMSKKYIVERRHR